LHPALTLPAVSFAGKKLSLAKTVEKWYYNNKAKNVQKHKEPSPLLPAAFIGA